MRLLDAFADSALTVVRDTIDRWLGMDFITDHMPVTVRYTNHNIVPVIPVFIQAPWGFNFQGHKFSVGGSKK